MAGPARSEKTVPGFIGKTDYPNEWLYKIGYLVNLGDGGKTFRSGGRNAVTKVSGDLAFVRRRDSRRVA